MNTIKRNNNPVILNNISKKALYFLVLSPTLFLLVNNWPYLLVSSVILSALAGLLFFATKNSVTTFHSGLLAILIIIYAYLTLSYFFSGQNISNFFSYPFLKNDGNFFFCYILFFVFAVPFLDYRKLADLYFKFIFAVFTFFSIFGIAEYFFSGYSIMTFSEPYAGKMFLALNFAHNATGSVYSIVCIFLFAFFLKEKKDKLKLWYLFLLLINLIALFITKSRGGYTGFMAGAIIVLWLNYRSIKKFAIAIGAMMLVFLPLIYATGIYKRLLQLFDIQGGTSRVRLMIWEKAWYLFSQSPLFGIGFGRFNDIYSIDRHIFDVNRLKGLNGLFAYYANQSFYFDTAHAHNSYLQFLSETGVLGLGLLLLFWILCLIKLINAYSGTKDEFSSKTFLAAVGSIFGILVLALSENYLSTTTIMIPMSILLSISIGLYWQENTEVIKF